MFVRSIFSIAICLSTAFEPFKKAATILESTSFASSVSSLNLDILLLLLLPSAGTLLLKLKLQQGRLHSNKSNVIEVGK